MSGINTVHPVDSSNSENGSISISDSSTEFERRELLREMETAVKNLKERNVAFMEILNGDSSGTDSIKHLFTGLSGTLLALAPACIYTLIPWNDAIKNPQYFYESLIVYCLSFIPNLAALWMTLFSQATNIKRNNTFQFFSRSWIF